MVFAAIFFPLFDIMFWKFAFSSIIFTNHCRKTLSSYYIFIPVEEVTCDTFIFQGLLTFFKILLTLNFLDRLLILLSPSEWQNFMVSSSKKSLLNFLISNSSPSCCPAKEHSLLQSTCYQKLRMSSMVK